MKRTARVFGEIRRRGLLQTTALYVMASWIVLQVANVLFPGAGIPDAAIAHVFLGTVLVFPLVLIFGWRYDITTRGIRKTPPSPELPGFDGSLNLSDTALLLALASMAVAAITLVSDRVSSEAVLGPQLAQQFEAPDNSIAILPFVNMSDDPANEYFGDGIAEELLNELANLRSLKVAARTSSFFFKGRNEPVQSIGRQLGVKAVLEGSVRMSGSRLRITAQLFNSANGYHIWSEIYDRQSGDVFAIQEEIARSIAAALEVQLLGTESNRLANTPTRSFDAYDFFLLGRNEVEKRNTEALEVAITLFERALALDEDFALGLTYLAKAYVFQVYYSRKLREDAASRATPLIERALELDPLLPEAHQTLGSVRLMLQDFDGAEEALLRALELRPNFAAAWSTLGYNRVLQSRLPEAGEAYTKAKALDPLNAGLLYNIGAWNMLRGQYDAGLSEFRRLVEIAPERSGTGRGGAHWATVFGRYDDAARWAIQATQENSDGSDWDLAFAQVYSALGEWDEAERFLDFENALTTDSMKNMQVNFGFLARSGQADRFSELANAQYARIDRSSTLQSSPTDEFRHLFHGIAAIQQDDLEQAERDFVAAAGPMGDMSHFVYDEIVFLKHLAYIYQRQGRADKAKILLDHSLKLALGARAKGWGTPNIYSRVAEIYAMLDEKDHAFTELQHAVDRGWLIANELSGDYFLDNIRDDPRFADIEQEVDRKLAEQRDAVMQVLAEHRATAGAETRLQ